MVEQQIKSKNIYTANEVAKYVTAIAKNDDSPVTILKLLNLLYIMQWFSLVVRDCPLFEDDIIAWDHCPVVESVRKDFERFNANPITDYNLRDVSQRLKSDKEALEVIDFVWEYFQDWTAVEFVNWSHNHDSPYTITPIGEVIEHDLLKAYFQSITKTKNEQ